jgi:flagella basal body P-ring formation protein FlgA
MQVFSVGDSPLFYGMPLALAKNMNTHLSLRRAALILLLIGTPLSGTCLHAADAAITDPELIRKAAARAVLERLDVAKGVADVTVDNLDPRLRLPACSQTLSGFISGDGQLRDHTAVGIRCDGTAHWTIYAQVSIGCSVPLLIARHALAQDSAPTASDFDVETRRMPGLYTHYISDPALLAGQRLRRTLAMGEVLTADALLTAPVIHRGDQITVIAQAGGMQIRASAIALSDGRPDDRIRAQNLSSQRVVEGVVRSAGVIEVVL